MTHTISRHNELPVIITSLDDEFDAKADQMEIQSSVRSILDTSNKDLFYIIDMSNLHLNLDTIILGMNQGAIKSESVWKHPKMRQLIFISTSRAMQMAVDGINSEIFGYFKAKQFATLDEGLTYIRNNI